MVKRLIDNPIPLVRGRVIQTTPGSYNEITLQTGLSDAVRGKYIAIEVGYVDSSLVSTNSIGGEVKTVELTLHGNDRGVFTRTDDARHFWHRRTHLNSVVDGIAIELTKIDDLTADGRGRIYTNDRFQYGIDSDGGSIGSAGEVTLYGWTVQLTSAEYLFYQKMYQ